MKRISKTPGPNLLTQYAQSHPQEEWDNGFRQHNQGHDYSMTRDLMIADQGGLCGYCETSISEATLPKRVEHFHDKSDKSTGHNWGLDWKNVFAVCNGGSGYETDQKSYPTPANLSCDAHKSHLKNRQFTAPEGVILNPLALLANPAIFELNKKTGELTANEEICKN